MAMMLNFFRFFFGNRLATLNVINSEKSGKLGNFFSFRHQKFKNDQGTRWNAHTHYTKNINICCNIYIYMYI